MKRPIRSGVWVVAALAVMVTLTGARSAAPVYPVYQRVLADSAAAVALPTPITSLAPFNNEGISPDSDPAVGNFDGGGRSYSIKRSYRGGILYWSQRHRGQLRVSVDFSGGGTGRQLGAN